MSPITHFLVSWLVADSVVERDRDKGLIALAGILPDLDGAGAVIDIVNGWQGGPETFYYGAAHHWCGHGLAACLLIAGCAAALGSERKRVFLFSLFTSHLHLVCDLVGSRGPAPEDFWPIFYLGPFSRHGEILWTGQWRLDGWQNLSITIVLLAEVFRRAWRWGRSPLSLLSPRANLAFVETLKHRFKKGGGRLHFDPERGADGR